MSPADAAAATSTSQWTTGIYFSIAASVIGAASKLCIRKSYTVLELESLNSTGEPPTGRIPCLTYLQAFVLRGIGVLGMTTLNPLFCVKSLTYASPSILAPFSGLTLVFIVACSEHTIGEKPSTSQVVAAALIVLGQIIIALCGDHTNIGDLSIDDVREAYLEPEFISYLIGMFGWIVLLVGLINYGDGTERRFSWGVIGGSVTGVQPFPKDALAVISGLQHENVPLEEYPPGLFFLLFLASAMPLIGLALLMQCMRRFDASFSASMFVGSMIISVSVMSAVRYDTFGHVDSILNGIFYTLGLCVLTSGCVVLACEGTATSDPTRINVEEKSNIFRRTSSEVTYGTVQLSDDQGTDSAASSIASEYIV